MDKVLSDIVKNTPRKTYLRSKHRIFWQTATLGTHEPMTYYTYTCSLWLKNNTMEVSVSCLSQHFLLYFWLRQTILQLSRCLAIAVVFKAQFFPQQQPVPCTILLSMNDELIKEYYSSWLINLNNIIIIIIINNSFHSQPEHPCIAVCILWTFKH